jgi:hypothetical protein
VYVCVVSNFRMVRACGVAFRRISLEIVLFGLDKLARVAIVDKWCVLPIEFLSQSVCLLLVRHERFVVTNVQVESSLSVHHLRESRHQTTEGVGTSVWNAPKCQLVEFVASR